MSGYDDTEPTLFPMPRRRKSPSVTPQMAGQIKTLVWVYGWMQHDVAAFFKINQGRVSEVVNGMLYPDEPPAPVAV